MAIPYDLNINTKETEKLSKYKDLENEGIRMWENEDISMPFITGALETIKKGLYFNLQWLPGHLSAIELQKITLMSTAHIICKVLG